MRKQGQTCSDRGHYYRETITVGQCRKNPPTTDGFPRLPPEGWCGEWQGEEE